jgi:PleD family two-component response regulator
VAERIRAGIAALDIDTGEGGKARISASLGVAAEVPSPRSEAARLLAGADAALYCAKEGGRNMVCESRLPVLPGTAPSPGAYMLQ